MKINKTLGYSILSSLAVLATTVWLMNSSFEVREKDIYVASFKERLVLFKYLDEGNYSKASRLLSILLTGDIITYEQINGGIDPKEHGICLHLNSKIKEKLVTFHREEKNENGLPLNLKKLEARCAE